MKVIILVFIEKITNKNGFKLKMVKEKIFEPEEIYGEK